MFLMHADFPELVDGEYFKNSIPFSYNFLTSGFWNGAIVFDEDTAVGAMFMISAILWALAAPIAIFIFLKVVALVLFIYRAIINTPVGSQVLSVIRC